MRCLRQILVVSGVLLAIHSNARAQVQTGSITGLVTDASGAVLPGASVSLSGEKLIGGVQTQATDATGNYRFDRLPPGSYHIKFDLQGFKPIERDDIRVSASFVATVNIHLEIGGVNESLTVTGESPTVDTKSNVQQTVMSQEILEGVPTGRDPWSLAKLIPGVQVATYDVGGTQSIQQSALSAHGSNTNDVSYNIDGATVNWPGGGGGATMLYYDQGMFEEVNYMTSAIPAEVMAGGVSINMVTKDAGNKWRGNTKYSFSSGCIDPAAQTPTPHCLESDNSHDPSLPSSFTGNPTKRLYDFNIGGGGALMRDRLWVTGSLRRWVVDKLTPAKNSDGSRAIDDNTLKNYSGKGVFSISTNQKASLSYNWNNKIRGHRRDTPPLFVPDIAALVQFNPASSTQAKYTGIRRKFVYESSFSIMNGETDYEYQPSTPPNAIRVVDGSLSTANYAAARREENPNSRLQFDNIVSYTASGWSGDHLLKAGVQFARLRFLDQYWVQGDMYIEYSNGKPLQIREFNTPTAPLSIEKTLGFFVQDSWTLGSKLTVNLGARFDNNRGTIPAQSVPAGTFIGPRTLTESNPINQSLGVWRTGISFDPIGNGQTALKASVSRYGLQVGIDRVTYVHPFQFQNQTCPWTDTNNNGVFDAGDLVGKCSGFPGLTQRYAGPNGPSWPYSDEMTAGIEHQVAKDIRVGAMYYHRTNRNQIGLRNLAVPATAYTPVTVTVPGAPTGPGGAVTVYNLNTAFNGLQDNVLDNQPYLDTNYNGVEVTASKRYSNRWQMLAGLTIGKNTGGLNASTGQSTASPLPDLNDPNNTLYPSGIVGNDSKVAFRLAGFFRAPGDVTVSGSLVSNGGYPYVSTYTVGRTIVPTLTRSSQVAFLSARGTERLPTVSLVDLRVSRPIKLSGGRQFVPQIELFNIGNASTVFSYTTGVGSSYLFPGEIAAPRIIKVGFSFDF